MTKNKYKSNRAPFIKPAVQYASTYDAARDDSDRFEKFQTRGKRRKQKKLKLGEH